MSKIFIDRLAFHFHRPRFFGKTSTSIVTQGVYGGGAIVKYVRFIGNAFGCSSVSGVCLNTLEPVSDKQLKKNEKALQSLSRRLKRQLQKDPFPVPSLAGLLIFRLLRNKIKSELSEEYRDYTYYREKGWFTSDFYYPVKTGLFKKAAGRFFDFLFSN